MYIAGIGSRETPPEILAWIEAYAARLVRLGNTIVSGNAEGADQAWARGANSVDPTKVVLCLPWRTYNEAQIVPGNLVQPFESIAIDRQRTLRNYASETHPKWQRLSLAAQKLHARNVLIVVQSNRVLGYLNHGKIGGGGTGMGFRVADRMRVPKFDISIEKTRVQLDAMIP